MEKEQAIKRLSAIEAETKELRKIIEASKDVKPLKDRVLTVDDVCLEAGTDIYQFNAKYNDYDEDSRAYELLKIIVKIFNEGWVPNWDDSNQYKYYPYFDMRSSGFGFSTTHCSYAYARTAVGSRLVFKDRPTAELCGKRFEKVYKQYLTI